MKRALTALLATPALIAASAPPQPDRQAWFGDLHLHTALSFDAYAWMGARVGPEDAYRFARGDVVEYLGKPVRRGVPLDFLAVTDHAENLGVFNQLEEPKSPLSLTEVGKLMLGGGREAFFKAMALMAKGANVGDNAPEVMAAAWAREVAAANAFYQPGRFTTFAAYEWTVNPANQNLHRNVIFRDQPAKAPFTRYDSDQPEALWAWLEKLRGEGIEALAIPHNGNVSNGLMWSMTKLDGSPIDAAWARSRAANEPVAEIAQSKGVSETHPLLSPNDEFAGFEIYPWLLAGQPIRGKVPGSYWRDALGRGLILQQQTGVNPYAYGAVGAGDLHSGISASAEDDFGLMGKANLGGGRMTRDEASHALFGDPSSDRGQPETVMGSGALTGVWAETNTRESIYAAFRRKETFATSGTRIRVRFFAGAYPANLITQPDWARAAYRLGTPMGGNLTAEATPRFAVQALKDPDGAMLDRIQIIKLWLDGDRQREQIFTVRRAARGAPELRALWTDPGYRRGQRAVYYARILERPTPRWTTLRAREFGLDLPKNAPAMIQERAWTSPIWVGS